jgi:hypothetical protein
MPARPAHQVPDYKESGVTHDALAANGVTFNYGDIVIMLSSGLASPGAATSGSRFLGIAMETKSTVTGDRIKVDIGGAQKVVTHAANLNINQGGNGAVAHVTGRNAVAAVGGDGPVCGKILETVTGGAGTSTVLLKLHAFDHTDLSS